MNANPRLEHASKLARKAEYLQEVAEVYMAVSLAMEEGQMTMHEADELIATKQSGGMVVASEHYPGDEWFDRATEALR